MRGTHAGEAGSKQATATIHSSSISQHKCAFVLLSMCVHAVEDREILSTTRSLCNDSAANVCLCVICMYGLLCKQTHISYTTHTHTLWDAQLPVVVNCYIPFYPACGYVCPVCLKGGYALEIKNLRYSKFALISNSQSESLVSQDICFHRSWYMI